MTTKEIVTGFQNIFLHLAERRLNPAFSSLRAWIKNPELLVFTEDLNALEETYRFMLKYTVDGTRDPERQKIYLNLIRSVYKLADSMQEIMLLKYSSSIEYEKKRLALNLHSDNKLPLLTQLEALFETDELDRLVDGLNINRESKLEMEQKQHTTIRDVFYYTWKINKLDAGESEFYSQFFNSAAIPVHYRAFIVSALLLSLIRYFDENKFQLLFELYDNENQEINQRALTGLLICGYKFDQRLKYYPAITGRFKILAENPAARRNLRNVIFQFIRSRDTEEIGKKIRDEIIPEMIKISPNLRNKINLDSLMEEGTNDEKNPEWQDIFSESPGLMDKMQEFSEMQMEGADVFMGSFSALKVFPFFNELSNWFIPFFAGNPDLGSSVSDHAIDRNFADAVSSALILCNSDKYSFCFSVQNLPAETRNFLSGGIKAEMEQFNEIEKEDSVTRPERFSEIISNQYLQDLYRFYKLFPLKRGLEDIFAWKFDFHNTIFLGGLLKEEPEWWMETGEFLFRRNYYDEALEFFNVKLEQEENGEIYQKVGYCYQQKGDYKKALNAYLKADLYGLNPGWNSKKIALCYRNLKKPARALEYYKNAEKNDPENLNIQLSIGHCYLELKEFDEALKCYFKVEYLAPGNTKVWRPIGWCSFVAGKPEQAWKYFEKVLKDAPQKHDFVNMGHIQWCLHNRKQAIEFYKNALTAPEPFTEAEFAEVFQEDTPYLVQQGIDPEEIPIMIDLLRYNLGMMDTP